MNQHTTNWTTGAREIPQFPFPRPGTDLPANYADLLATDEIAKVRLWNGDSVWLASQYDHVRAILGDNRFSAGAHHANYPSISEARRTVTSTEPVNLLRLDVPEHTVLRRMLAGEFTPARMDAMRPMMIEIVDRLIDDLLEKGPPAEFVHDFALALPSHVIARILGVPYGDHEFFQERTLTKLTLDIAPEVAVKAGDDQRDYLRHLLTEKNKCPEAHDDLVGRLLVKHINTGELSFEDAVATIELLLIAGHETTANMTGLGTISLIQNRDVFRAIADDDSGRVAKRAVEEMLRYHAIVQFTASRVAKEDIAVGGVTIRAGEGVLAMITPANHDPRQFARPDEFDIGRPLVPPHLAFGFGVHQCLGQPLARAEMAVAFQILARRLPGLEIACPFEDLVFKGNSMVHGVGTLPVAW